MSLPIENTDKPAETPIEEADECTDTQSRSSTRERKLTENGQELCDLLTKKHERAFNKVYDSWKLVARETRTTLKTLCSVESRLKTAEEMARMDRKIEDSRDGMRREMEFLYNRNIQALNEVNQKQTAKHERSVSPVHSQPERDVDMYKDMQMQVIQKMEHQLKKQDKKWESRLQEIKAQHETEKNQLLNKLSRMQTPPFSSEEDSEDDVTDEDEEQPLKHQQGKSLQPRLNQATPIQIRAGKASPLQARQAVVKQSPAFSLQQSRVSVGSVTKTKVTKMESDKEEDDWSEVSELQEIDPRQLQSYKDQNGNVEKKNHGLTKASVTGLNAVGTGSALNSPYSFSDSEDISQLL